MPESRENAAKSTFRATVGAIYTIETSMAAQDRAFQDGYGYMDDEAVVERAVSANNREILCYERKVGHRYQALHRTP